MKMLNLPIGVHALDYSAITPTAIYIDGDKIAAEYSICYEDETAFIRLNMSDGRRYSIWIIASINAEIYTAVMEAEEFGVSTEFDYCEFEELLALAERD